MKDLTRELERLTGAAVLKRRELDSQIVETSAKQVELDKTAEEFRALHNERKEISDRWRESLEAIKTRDKEIAAAGERFAALKAAQSA